MTDLALPASEVSIRVRFAETDAMGVAHHASYLLYFEVGRIEAMRQLGASYVDLENAGCSLAVGGLEVRYAAPARFDQLLTVQTWVETCGSRGVTFRYKIIDACTGQVVVTGLTKLVCIDRGGTVRHIPSWWLEAMRKSTAVG
jgi:acyl-CoA thioester hydrolase